MRTVNSKVMSFIALILAVFSVIVVFSSAKHHDESQFELELPDLPPPVVKKVRVQELTTVGLSATVEWMFVDTIFRKGDLIKTEIGTFYTIVK